jgi:hypothetical protein
MKEIKFYVCYHVSTKYSGNWDICEVITGIDMDTEAGLHLFEEFVKTKWYSVKTITPTLIHKLKA